MSSIATSAQSVLSHHVVSHSQATFIYDSANGDSGGQTISGSKPYEVSEGEQALHKHPASKVWRLETRSGAGAALAGYINNITGPSTSTKTLSSLPVSALVQPYTLQAMVPSLLSLSDARRPPYAVHVSTLSSEGHQLSEDLGSVIDSASYLACDRTAILFSGSNPRDIVKYGIEISGALASSGYDVIHAFDGLEGGRELAPAAVLASASRGLYFNEPRDLADAVSQAISNSLVAEKSNNGWFTYVGAPNATQALVIPASSASAHAASLISRSSSIGVVLVHVLRPWAPARLAEVLPPSLETAHVYAQSGSDGLVESVLLATLELKRNVRVVPFATPKAARWTAQQWYDQVSASVTRACGPPSIPGSPNPQTSIKNSVAAPASKICQIWSSDDNNQGARLPFNLAHTFSSAATTVEARLFVEYDNFSQGGLQQASLLLSNDPEQATTAAVASTSEKPNLVVIQSPTAVLTSYAALSKDNLSSSTQILVAAPGWTPEEFDIKLDAKTKRGLWQVYGSHARATGGLWTIDVKNITARASVAQENVTEIAVWLLYLGEAAGNTADIATLLSSSSMGGCQLEELIDLVKASLNRVNISHDWEFGSGATESKAEEIKVDVAELETDDRPARLIANAVSPNKYKSFSEPPSTGAQWHDVAKKIIYSEAFVTSVENEHRPDLPEENFILEVTENRRLTPLDYDRNVFHLELSTAGTGMKYAVGEALGVHGWNDEDDVKEFLSWYGLNPEEVVSVPSRQDPFGKSEIRTVFQAFQQNLDIFGKPPKSFYEELSKVAKIKAEKDHLRFIASAEGSSTFRKWSELETVTYADVFKAFPSAKFSVGDLVKQVQLIKPRHYSIASSQNFVGDSVHLLIVTVDWKTPTGSMRFGQCTRYLADLKKGAKVMVSVKPSVMKLPPLDSQPIIMAGLGTGAAPFRAFIQERAWQKAQGIEVGPLVYYFGSRYRGKEYLYGEELEAYMQDGIVTHAGLAFSRDGPDKVYIQHKMNEDGQMLADMLTTSGVFYLCGPTWPVPDVYEALCSALENNQGHTREQAEGFISRLKEEEKYVLEVY